MRLSKEEYIEQEYFFRVYRERLLDGVPSQEILRTIQEEILSTTQLPMALDFMRAEILHNGRITDAMARLSHYFAPFQTFVIRRAEDDVSRFEQTVALEILAREAKYRSEMCSQPGLFVFQFECIARNRLGYHDGLVAMAMDPVYDEAWQQWIRSLNTMLGARELSELVYRASQHYQTRKNQHSDPADNPDAPMQPRALFGEQDGRIARANIGRDPMFFFAALQRQLGYPAVPLSKTTESQKLPAFLEARLNKIEQRLKLLDMESKGGIDLTRFYQEKPNGKPKFPEDVDPV